MTPGMGVGGTQRVTRPRAPTLCSGKREFARPQLTPLKTSLSPLPPGRQRGREGAGRGCQDRGGGAGGAGGTMGEGSACVRRASTHRPRRGGWNVQRKHVDGNSKSSPDEKQRVGGVGVGGREWGWRGGCWQMRLKKKEKVPDFLPHF